MPLSRTNLGVLYLLTAIGLISLIDTTCKFFTDELHAVFQIPTRRIAGVERHQTTLLYTSIAGTIWASVPAPFFWTPPTARHWLVFLVIGAMGAGAHFCVIQAFRNAQASLLAPFNYSKLIWVTILGHLVFDDLPGLDTVIGSTVIAAAGLYVLYREGRSAGEVRE